MLRRTCAMSGIYSGVQAVIRADGPSAVYVHCSAHCLNLVLSKSYEIPEIKLVMAVIQNACLYFKTQLSVFTLCRQQLRNVVLTPDTIA